VAIFFHLNPSILMFGLPAVYTYTQQSIFGFYFYKIFPFITPLVYPGNMFITYFLLKKILYYKNLIFYSWNDSPNWQCLSDTLCQRGALRCCMFTPQGKIHLHLWTCSDICPSDCFLVILLQHSKILGGHMAGYLL